MIFRPSMLDSDFGGELPETTCCIFSRWQGYLKQPEWERIRDKLAAAGGNLIDMHTSGHAFVDDVTMFVEEVRPAEVIPIHTFEPEALRFHFVNSVSIEDGQTHEV